MPRIHIKVGELMLEVLDKLVDSKLYENRTDLIIEALSCHQPIKRLLDQRTYEEFAKIVKLVEPLTEKAVEKAKG